MLQRFAITITLLSLTFTAWVHAQVVHFPDPNLRAAIAEASGANPDRITVVALRRMITLRAHYAEIESLEGLQFAVNLTTLDLEGNRISDLTPISNLRNLEDLRLPRNVIKDISPLAGLTNLRVLALDHNFITDVEALAGLSNLREIAIEHNSIPDYSPLDNLSLNVFVYDQICDMPPEPLEPRLANRSFPSIFASFSTEIVNKVRASEGILEPV